MTKRCRNCGRSLEEKKKGRPKIYCCGTCRQQYFYATQDDQTCSSERVSTCGYCGKEFDNRHNQNRKYCCQAHSVAARFGREPTVAVDGSAIRKEKIAEVLGKRDEGFSYTDIGKEMGISRNTVKTWARRYAERYQPERDVYSGSSPDQITTNTISEFDSIEIRELPETAERRIFLLCGAVRFAGKYDHFAAQVPQLMAYNLHVGDAFVYCNRSRYQLSVLQWQGDGFALMFRRTEQERYPWPFFTDPKAVEITRSDLEMLIEYPRFMRRLRGLATPDFLP